MFADAFAEIAASLSAEFGGPYHAGKLIWQTEAEYDDGGSIVTPGGTEEFECRVQVDAVTESMRLEAGYTDKDVRLIILASGLTRPVDSDAVVEVLPGDDVPALHVGRWSVQSGSTDPLGVAFDGRGRRA